MYIDVDTFQMRPNLSIYFNYTTGNDILYEVTHFPRVAHFTPLDPTYVLEVNIQHFSLAP